MLVFIANCICRNKKYDYHVNGKCDEYKKYSNSHGMVEYHEQWCSWKSYSRDVTCHALHYNIAAYSHRRWALSYTNVLSHDFVSSVTLSRVVGITCIIWDRRRQSVVKGEHGAVLCWSEHNIPTQWMIHTHTFETLRMDCAGREQNFMWRRVKVGERERVENSFHMWLSLKILNKKQQYK